MSRHNLRAAILSLGLLLPSGAWAAEYGTADEARAMLDRVIAEMKADPAKALAKVNAGEGGGFVDRDLYPFCIGPDARVSGHPSPEQLGKHASEIKDVDGKTMTEEMLKVAEEGKVAEVEYKWPRLGSTEPTPKVSFVTRIGDQVCGVGYYK
jgi:signal transduction histidine kinase